MAVGSVTYNGFACTDPVSVYKACVRRHLPTWWYGLPNRYYCPRGRGPGRAYILLRIGFLLAAGTEGFQTLAMTDPFGNAIAFNNMIFLRAACLTPGIPGDPTAIYLCELRDMRH